MLDYNNSRFRPRILESISILEEDLGDDLYKIWIFGSLARKEGKLTSDIDLLVAVKGAVPERRQRFSLYSKICDEDENGLKVDLRFCSRDTFNSFSKTFTALVLHDRVLIYEEGKCLL